MKEKYKRQKRYAELFAEYKRIWPDINDFHTQEITHYSGPDGARGILSKRKIWLSNLKDQKDNEECSYRRQIIDDALIAFPMPGRFAFLLQSRGPNEWLGMGLSWNYHVACFYSDSNEAEHMWCKYGKEGTGAALTFDLPMIVEASDSGNYYAIHPICYDYQTQIDRTVQALKFANGKNPHSKFRRSQLMYWVDVTMSLIWSTVLMKKSKFKEEREVRIGVANAEHTFTIERRDYTSVVLPRNALKRVVLGPNASADLQRELEESATRDWNPQVEVVRSSLALTANESSRVFSGQR
jgi:hypothetical protein